MLQAVLALTCFAGSPSLPGDVWVVDAVGGGDFFEIQDAIDAADQQDTILVRAGTYAGFDIGNKALDVVADAGAHPEVVGFMTISALPKGRAVSVSGLWFREGFEVHDCDGPVLFTDCLFEELTLADFVSSGPPTAPGLHRVLDCADVVFSGSTLRGRDGDTFLYCIAVYDGAHGENGLYVSSSKVALYSCVVQGGTGGWSEDGNCGILTCDYAFTSWGGHGISADQSSFVYVDGTQPQGGPRGDHHDCDGHWDGQDGEDFASDGTATLRFASDPLLTYASPSVLREDEVWSLDVAGPAGANVWVLWSPTQEWRYFGTNLGILHLRSSGLEFVPLGKIDATGTLQVDLAPPQLPAGKESQRIYAEVYAISAGTRLLGNVRGLTVLDPAF